MAVDSQAPDARLTDLTGFAAYDHGDEANIDVPRRVLPTNSGFAGDFRASGKLLPEDVAVFTTEVMPSSFRFVDPVI